MEQKIFEKVVKIIITPQAQKIIKESNHSLEEFEEWALEDQKISLGGNNAVVFLEAMYNKRNQ